MSVCMQVCLYHVVLMVTAMLMVTLMGYGHTPGYGYGLVLYVLFARLPSGSMV